MAVQETIECALSGENYKDEIKDLDDHIKKLEEATDIGDATKETAAKAAIGAAVKKIIEKSSGVALGIAGGFLASQTGQAIGGLVGPLVVAGGKAISNARTKSAIDYICVFFKQNKTLPPAKIIAAGKYNSSTVAVGRSEGIHATVTVQFLASAGKMITQGKELKLNKDGRTVATKPEMLITDETFDGIKTTEKISCGFLSQSFPVILEKKTTLVPVCDSTLGKEKLYYIAYVCIKGKCVPLKDIGLKWNDKFTKEGKAKMKIEREKIRKEHEKKIDEDSESEKSQFDRGNLQERKQRVF